MKIAKISSASILVVCVLATYQSRADWKSIYGLDFRALYAQKITRTHQTNSNRYSLEFQQEFQDKPSTFRFGFQAVGESAFGANPDRYSADYARRNSSQLILRDNYFELFSGSLFLRLGYQQVVWGEAFGSFFADVVNPKDLSRAGLGSLAEQRLQIPMVNLKYIGRAWSIQALAIPVPSFNRLPEPGGDYFIFPGERLGISPSQIQYETQVKGEFSENLKPESGLRLTSLFGSWDFSWFTLSGYDRNPYYTGELVSFNPVIFRLQPRSVVYTLYGMTLTNDFDGVLLRSELIFHRQRPFQIYESNQLGYRRVDQWVGVLGLDFNQMANWQLGVQWSFDQLHSTESIFFREKRQDLAQLRLAREWKIHRFEAAASGFLADQGYLLQSTYTYVLGRATELDFGLDYFDGPAKSQAGQLRDAGRVFLMFRMKDAG